MIFSRRSDGHKRTGHAGLKSARPVLLSKLDPNKMLRVKIFAQIHNLGNLYGSLVKAAELKRCSLLRLLLNGRACEELVREKSLEKRSA